MRDEFQVCVRPLLSNQVLHLLHRLREASVDTSLKYVPQILNRVEVRTLGWPFDESDSFLMEIGDCLRSSVEANIVLLKIPRSIGVELAEGLDQAMS